MASGSCGVSKGTVARLARVELGKAKGSQRCGAAIDFPPSLELGNRQRRISNAWLENRGITSDTTVNKNRSKSKTYKNGTPTLLQALWFNRY